MHRLTIDGNPPSRDRLLAELLLVATAFVEDEGGCLRLDTGDFVDALAKAGFHVEAGDAHLLITVPQ